MTHKSTRPIWSQRSTSQEETGRRALNYCAGRDVAERPAADAELIPYDLWTNRAHGLMLKKCKIISPAIHRKIVQGLGDLEQAWLDGNFTLNPNLEDVHMNIEGHVTAVMGEEAGGAMHTARSRNDQSATDVRLWLRTRLLDRLAAVAGTVQTLARMAGDHAETICPGWTHGQPAMPTTLGHWAAAHGWALARDAAALRALWPLINCCPLGSAAAFGTSWSIDRLMTARLLGFDDPTQNSLDTISTRGEVETRVGGALGVMMTHLSSLGQDLIFLSSPPRQAIRLSDAHVTGSSIMPNKRNPDFAEVTRARAQAVHGLVLNLMSVGRGALSGYNRDMQWTKYWIMDLLWEVGEAPEVFSEALEVLQVDKKGLARLATEVLLGKKLSELNLERKPIPHYGVKEAVFPFNMFPEVDPLLGPEMRSTGEVLGMASDPGLAFYNAQLATLIKLPTEGTVLMTVTDHDKQAALEVARELKGLGFTIKATEGTYNYLKTNGVESELILKEHEGRPNVTDAIKNEEVKLVINTPSGKLSAFDDSYIRKAAIRYKLPYITTIAAALAATKGIAALKNGPDKLKSLQEYHLNIPN